MIEFLIVVFVAVLFYSIGYQRGLEDKERDAN
jgi:hypothetical protein